MIAAPRIIVSMTSFPEALSYAVQAARSVLEGSLLPDKLVLYLDSPKFPDRIVPTAVAALQSRFPRFEVRFCDGDIRSYTKLVPALADFPDDVIVTIDDDILYHRNMLRDLVRVHKRFPSVIVAHRAKRVLPDRPYRRWPKYRWYHFLTGLWRFDFATMPTGVGGVLYPPHSLDPAMINPALFMSMAPTVDDVWFWAAAVSAGTYVVPVPFGPHNKPRSLGKPRALSLKTLNFRSGEDRNAAALATILAQYPAVKQRLAPL